MVCFTPGGNAVIQNPTDSSPNITFNQQGYYSTHKISLKISNGNCSSTISKDSILIGTVPSFILNSSSCKNIPLTFINTSSRNTKTFKWSVTPNSGFTMSSDTAKNPTIKFAVPGCYKVLLQTSRTDSILPNYL